MAIQISGDNQTMKVSAGGKVEWPFTVTADSDSVSATFSVTTGPDESNAPDWEVSLHESGVEILSNFTSNPSATIKFPGKKTKELKLVVECPSGARFGDNVSVEVVFSDGPESDSMSFKAIAQQSIMILKTQMDQEKSVVQDLYAKAKADQKVKDIYAILSPQGLRGYVFVEGMNTERVREKVRDIKKARSFVESDDPGKQTTIDDISAYLTPVSAVIGIVEGDIVELVNGPFKGEKARVQQIDQSKEEITVELIEAMVPIPVTVKGDSVRVIEKEK